jgi:hypothetical protein
MSADIIIGHFVKEAFIMFVNFSLAFFYSDLVSNMSKVFFSLCNFFSNVHTHHGVIFTTLLRN